MSIDKLQNETCDDIHHLSDHELEVVTGGSEASAEYQFPFGANNQNQAERIVKRLFGG